MTGIYPDYRGVPIVGASAYIPEYGWTLLAEIDTAEAFASIRTLGIIAMIIGITSAAVVTCVGIIFALSTARPIRKLMVATDKFREGDLKFRANVARRDEIGLLAHSFNDMADQLEKYIDERKDAEEELRVLNVSLEHRVAERTEELTKVNEALEVEIAERKQMVDRNKTIISTALDGFWVVDTQGRILDVNDAYCRLTGYSREEMLNMSIPDVEALESPEDTAQRIQKIIKTGSDRFESKHKCKDGKIIDIEVSTNFLDINGGRIFGFMRDITERKQMVKQVETSLKEKEVLLKEIHHRVKNNMQVIISLLALQSGHIKSEQPIGDILKDSQNRVKAMALVHEKLHQTGDLASVNFYEYTKHLANDIFQSFRDSISNIELKVNVDNITLDIDTAILCGLIINELITNSLKYAFPTTSAGQAGRANGRGEVTITMRRTADLDSEIELIISDNGVGMPKYLDFRNTESLGLHLVNTLVEQLNGKINLNRGKGTEFQIKFKGIKDEKDV
jgi:PAS domain S-box-containing protein